jgi:hypothetical protein
MLARLSPRLTYANVVSTICLCLVVGGGSAYAANTIFSTDIVDGEVKTPDLASGAVTGGKVADNSLSGTDVIGRPGTSTTPAVNGSLTTEDIAGQQANAANGTPFMDGTLTQWDVKNGALVGADLANNTVGGGKIANDSLTGSKVAADSLTSSDIDESSLGEVMSAALGGRGDASGVQHHFVACDPGTTAFESCAATEIVLPAPSKVLLIAQVTGFGSGDVPESAIASGDCLLETSHGVVADSTITIEVETQREHHAPLVGITDVLPAGFSAFGVECNDRTADDSMMYFDAAIAAVALSSIEG